jgi:hypothetical protein
MVVQEKTTTMKDHILALLKLAQEKQKIKLKVLFDKILGDLDWIDHYDDYCKSVKLVFLGVSLDNLFYRQTSQY